MFDADLVHAGSLNLTGARRRSILIGYFSEPLYGLHLETAKLRGVRMDTKDRFDPLVICSGLSGPGEHNHA